MDEKQVKLSDYVNRPRFESQKDIDRQVQESLRTETDKQVRQETFAALGATDKVAKIAIPQPTMGVFPLLEMIESPFLKSDPNVEIRLQQIYETLYVLCRRREAVAPIYRAFRAEERMKAAAELAEKSPDFYYAYLRAIAEFASWRNDFDLEVANFADELGVFDMLAAIELVNEYLNASTGGFTMIPAAAAEQDKKKDLT
jgi:hypothetical protein